jgi:hypothetical protein
MLTILLRNNNTIDTLPSAFPKLTRHELSWIFNCIIKDGAALTYYLN